MGLGGNRHEAIQHAKCLQSGNFQCNNHNTKCNDKTSKFNCKQFNDTFKPIITNDKIFVIPNTMSVPDTVKDILILGMSFIPTATSRNNEQETIDRWVRSIKLNEHFGNNPSKPQNIKPYTSKIKLTSTFTPTSFKRPMFTQAINTLQAELQAAVTDKFKTIMTTNTSMTHTPTITHNLNKKQKETIKSIQNNTSIVIQNADKNCGVCIIDRNTYIAAVNEQLSDTKTYRKLTKINQVQLIFKETAIMIKIIITQIQTSTHIQAYLKTINPSILPFLIHHYDKAMLISSNTDEIIKWLAPCYGLPKTHKKILSWRLIIASLNWITTPPSLVVDAILQQFLSHSPSYLKDTNDLLTRLKSKSIPISDYDNISLIAIDIVALYPSIPTNEALVLIEKLLKTYGLNNEQLQLIIRLLALILKKNVFTFNLDWFVQLIGTAMGTPAAVSFATLFLAAIVEPWYKEFERFILLFTRFVDDFFLIVNTTNATIIKCMLDKLNTLHPNIKITYEISTTSVNYLDLVIYKPSYASIITQSHFTLSTKTFQKPINTYQYIPPHSYHMPHMFKSFITAELGRYKKQCTLTTDFISLKHQFHDRLIARGYDPLFLKPIFDCSLESIKTTSKLQNKPRVHTFNLTNSIFFTANTRTRSNQFKNFFKNTNSKFLANNHKKSILSNNNNNNNLQFIYKNPPSLGKLLIRANLRQESSLKS